MSCLLFWLQRTNMLDVREEQTVPARQRGRVFKKYGVWHPFCKRLGHLRSTKTGFVLFG
jgi:hypothetical protein